MKIKDNPLLCCVKILNKCLNEKNPELYDFIANAFKCLDSTKRYVVGFDTLFLIKFCKIMGISPFNKALKNIRNAVLNIEDGVFVQNENILNNNTIIPNKESYEIYKLSHLMFTDLESYNIEAYLNTKVFDYMILYISAHLVDLSKLKSVKVLKELV